MKFRFRLEKALQFAHLKEVTKKGEYAAAVQRVGELKERHHLLAANQRAFLELAGRHPDMARAHYQNTKIRADLVELRKLEQAVANEQTAADKIRVELGRLAMRRKALESLRERRYQEYRVGETRHEQNRIDESYRNLPKK